MTRSTKAPVPGSMLIVLGIPAILAVVALLYLLRPGNAWMPYLRTLRFPIGTRQSEEARLKVRVWVNKSTGIYYCPASAMYGHSERGVYMAQGEAVQTGFTPALGEPCQ
jgi:hypothetical protein